MGTQCAERQEAAHSSRQRCHHRGREKVGGRERKRAAVKKGGLFFSHFVYRLSVASPQICEDQTHTDLLTRTAHIHGIQAHTCVEAGKSSRHTDLHPHLHAKHG